MDFDSILILMGNITIITWLERGKKNVLMDDLLFYLATDHC